MSDDSKHKLQVREGQRVAKVMARAGLCSRRDAEVWIAAGRVTVNGKTLDSPAYNVSEADDVLVDGKPLAARERTRLFLFHKPRGLVTTARDPEGRPTIFDALPPDLPRLVAIGRLDINTEGLLLLTNDGGLARVLELPATGWLRRYRVRAHGRIDQAQLDSLIAGVTVDGIDYASIQARLDREQGSNAWITIGLREGKNREIKRVLEHMGLAVNRLIRVSFGPFELGDLAEGEVAEVRTRVVREQLGAKLAREASVDFDAPAVERGEQQRSAPAEKRGRRESPAPKRATGESRALSEQGRRFGESSPRRRESPPSTPERRRKHVSALRAEIAADSVGQRKRVERSATHDSKGRTVAVERLSPAGGEAQGSDSAKSRATRKAGTAAAGKGRGRFFGWEREAGERPRPDSFELKRMRKREDQPRPPRGDRKEQSTRGKVKSQGESRFQRQDGARTKLRDDPPQSWRNSDKRSQNQPQGGREGKGGASGPRPGDSPRRSSRSPGKEPSKRGTPRPTPRKH